MTLPQHLEPFLFRDNPSLNCALKAADPKYGDADETDGTLAQVFIGIITQDVCQAYCDHILLIRELSSLASRQLALDIGNYNHIVGVIFYTRANVRNSSSFALFKFKMLTFQFNVFKYLRCLSDLCSVLWCTTNVGYARKSPR